MTDREQALLALAAALWRELAGVRQAATCTNCFDNGSPHGQVRNVGEVKELCAKFHGYHGAGSVAVYAFGVYERGGWKHMAGEGSPF